jgi:hypothetical protein
MTLTFKKLLKLYEENKQIRFPILNKIIYLSTWIILCIGILKRDYRLQNKLTNSSLVSEFNPSMILCNDLPRCLRLTGHGFGFLLENINGVLFTKIFNLSEYHTNYISVDERENLIQNFTSIQFRVIMLFPLVSYLLKLTNNLTQKTLIALSLTSIISGYPLVYIDRFFDMYLTIPDYAAIFAIGIYLNYKKKLLNSTLSTIFFMVFLTLTYENLALALGIAEVFNKKKPIKSRIVFLSTSIIITGAWISSFYITQYLSDNSFSLNVANTEYFRNSNFSHLHLVIISLFTLFLWPTILGLLVTFKDRHVKLVKDKNLNLLFGLLATYLLATLTSGIDAEGARQTLPGQLLCFTIFVQFLETKKGK